MEENKYIVFNCEVGPYEGFWEQESNPLTLERAKKFKEDCERRHPENYYRIMVEVKI